MKPFFHFDTDETRQSLLARARNVALWAIQQYELDWNCIRFIQLSDTITYKIETVTKESYLLRIHSERVNKEEILSELVFLNELGKINDLVVPEGIRSRSGSYIFECETDEGYRKPYVSLMKWVEGEHSSGEFTDNHVNSMGVMMGKLHEASASFEIPPDFVRPHWGSDSFRKEVSKLERYYPRFLSDGSWKLYQEAIDKIIRQFDSMKRDNRNYGLIHADLHSGNVVFNNGIPNPIDFGRCGYGYYLYDMSASLLELYPRHRWLLIQGYESVVKLNKDYIRDLECFFIMFMIENYCHHSSDTREIPSLINEQKYALAYIKEYINDRPFLFEVIEPVDFESNLEEGPNI
ncbi:phosphotransferase enzyme family protein [Paenibacillus crassostreae]|uniref:Aminoglycoside phosphotransferase n=1 Tax=Paenibacillus crassostreae TaxID=1763538 RepID=A0A167FEW1_9BACL|nr:phosphotransferase [Paenibacillus crassostreae]AOZ94480.1 aminoglycoside phosphotransferase [Paenibacillus crassostreae]OAB76482.1 aminoglycoside phosphotransferase [Paenibacillus crassostreae]